MSCQPGNGGCEICASEGLKAPEVRESTENEARDRNISTARHSTRGDGRQRLGTRQCMKCKSRPSNVFVRQRDPVCRDCAYTIAVSKVRQCLRLKIQLVPSDKILVCLSGGPASRAMLQLVADCQSDDKGHPGRSKVPFDMMMAHVDESAACGLPAAASEQRKEQIWDSVKGHVKAEQFLFLPLEDVFIVNHDRSSSPESTLDRRKRLHSLVQSVPDSTGRQDLVKALREALLVAVACKHHVTRVARGDSASRLAARAIALAAKGSGYALPASLHYIDARFGNDLPMWISPVRDLTAKDLAMVTYFRCLETVPKVEVPQYGSQTSINTLAEHFIATASESMPSTVHAVLGTACKLKPFSWNSLEGVGATETCCEICSSPMSTMETEVAIGNAADNDRQVCQSCRQQFWGQAASSSSSPGPPGSTEFRHLMPDPLFPLLGVQDTDASHDSGNVSDPDMRATLKSRDWMKSRVGDCLL